MRGVRCGRLRSTDGCWSWWEACGLFSVLAEEEMEESDTTDTPHLSSIYDTR